MNKYFLLCYLISCVFGLQAQVIYNADFGFKMSIPTDLELTGSIPFDYTDYEATYTFLLSPVSDDMTNNGMRWDNGVILVARANGRVHNLQEVMEQERKRLNRYDNLAIEEEGVDRFVYVAEIGGKDYKLLALFKYENGIGYTATYSNRTAEFDKNKNGLESFFERMEFFVPEVNYQDLEGKLAREPDNLLMHEEMGTRAFHFHQYERAREEYTAVLEEAPFFGDIYYMRAWSNLALGDTVRACRDFKASIANDYLGESELVEFCQGVDTEYRDERLHDTEELMAIDESADHSRYIDSVRQHKYLLISFSNTPSDEMRAYIRHVNHLFRLDYATLDSLCLNETGVLQLYAFGIFCNKFPDRITKKHKRILKSREQVPVMTSRQEEPEMVDLSEISKKMYDSLKEDDEDKKYRKKVEKVVKDFIRAYALYPKSYESLGYEDFRIMGVVDMETGEKYKGDESSSILHRYRLKNVNGTYEEVIHVFKLNGQLQITIIEEEWSNTVMAYPPQIDEWLQTFGRELNDKDKKTLGL